MSYITCNNILDIISGTTNKCSNQMRELWNNHIIWMLHYPLSPTSWILYYLLTSIKSTNIMRQILLQLWLSPFSYLQSFPLPHVTVNSSPIHQPILLQYQMEVPISCSSIACKSPQPFWNSSFSTKHFGRVTYEIRWLATTSRLFDTLHDLVYLHSRMYIAFFAKSINQGIEAESVWIDSIRLHHIQQIFILKALTFCSKSCNPTIISAHISAKFLPAISSRNLSNPESFPLSKTVLYLIMLGSSPFPGISSSKENASSTLLLEHRALRTILYDAMPGAMPYSSTERSTASCKRPTWPFFRKANKRAQSERSDRRQMRLGTASKMRTGRSIIPASEDRVRIRINKPSTRGYWSWTWRPRGRARWGQGSGSERASGWRFCRFGGRREGGMVSSGLEEKNEPVAVGLGSNGGVYSGDGIGGGRGGRFGIGKGSGSRGSEEPPSAKDLPAVGKIILTNLLKYFDTLN